jgi:hypothetical protein
MARVEIRTTGPGDTTTRRDIMTQRSTGAARPRGQTQIEMNGMRCTLHMPQATKSRYGEHGEVTQRLAPGAPQELFLVDDFPAAPREWVRSDPAQGVATYFCLAKGGHMVWFDLNGCDQQFHVAAIISAQGINAITGRKMMPPVRLEQYGTECPVHGTAFGPRKRCADCGFEWPDQNYVATTAVRPGSFWRDGFRAADGKTREFLFTEEVERGVAAHVIGDERMDAFAVRLYRSRDPRPQPQYRTRGGGFLGADGGLESAAPKTLGGGARRSLAATPRSFEVGAGAVVNQDVERDPSRLDSWNADPTATFVIYYVDQEVFEELMRSGGGRTGGNEGFLGGMPVGTP